jgi:hypothetical protein
VIDKFSFLYNKLLDNGKVIIHNIENNWILKIKIADVIESKEFEIKANFNIEVK